MNGLMALWQKAENVRKFSLKSIDSLRQEENLVALNRKKLLKRTSAFKVTEYSMYIHVYLLSYLIYGYLKLH